MGELKDFSLEKFCGRGARNKSFRPPAVYVYEKEREQSEQHADGERYREKSLQNVFVIPP
jgi:hypothetical protein